MNEHHSTYPVLWDRFKHKSTLQLVYGNLGWQTYSVIEPPPAASQDTDGAAMSPIQSLPRQLDSSGGLPKSACLGVLGVPGLTAYFALIKVCAAKAGETLVISSAAGQTGHIVGQVNHNFAQNQSFKYH